MTDQDDNLSPVMLPSGSLFKVHDSEVAYFQERVKKYLADNHFTNISDFQDLDRVIMAELLTWRWGIWVSQKRDYWGEPIDEQAWQKAIKEHSAELRQLKKALGIDKETRDKQRGEGSVADFIEKLKFRAKEFGVTRDEQHALVIEKFQQLKAVYTLWNNCTEEERREQHITTDEFMQWIEKAIAEFDEIDADFRSRQKMWIMEM